MRNGKVYLTTHQPRNKFKFLDSGLIYFKKLKQISNTNLYTIPQINNYTYITHAWSPTKR